MIIFSTVFPGQQFAARMILMILLAAARFLLKFFLSGLGSRVPYNNVSIVSIFVRYFWEFLGIFNFSFFPFFLGGFFLRSLNFLLFIWFLFVFFSKGGCFWCCCWNCSSSSLPLCPSLSSFLTWFLERRCCIFCLHCERSDRVCGSTSEREREREWKIEGKRTEKEQKNKKKGSNLCPCVRGIRQSSVVALIKKHWTEVCCGEGEKK